MPPQTDRLLSLLASVLCAGSLAACAPPAPGAGSPSAVDTARQSSVPSRPDSGGLIPAGLGSLRQEDISIRLDLGAVAVQLTPVDEGIIRVLSADSYRMVRDLAAERAAEIERYARVHQLRERNVWMATFFGLAAGGGARFAPGELTLTQSGRELRPLEIVALTRGFGGERLQAGETQRALYLFEDGLNLAQPIVATMGAARNAGWETILRAIETEKALIRTRRGGSEPAGAR